MLGTLSSLCSVATRPGYRGYPRRLACGLYGVAARIGGCEIIPSWEMTSKRQTISVSNWTPIPVKVIFKFSKTDSNSSTIRRHWVEIAARFLWPFGYVSAEPINASLRK